MPQLNKITEFLDDYLRIDDIDDACWNGLQFQGNQTVSKIAFAVDACVEAIAEAENRGAQMLITHHGHYWRSQNPSVRDWSKERIDLLYKNNLSLYSCHLPLDRHPKVGNNVELIKLLGARVKDEFYFHRGKNIGWTGEWKKPVSINNIVKTLNSELNTVCRVLNFGKKNIKTIAVCSGGGSYSGFYDALDRGVDLYLTGDAVEVYYSAKDAGINVIFAGHHATETVGLLALSKEIKRKFKVKTDFIDLPTGL